MAPGNCRFHEYGLVPWAKAQCQSETFALPISQRHEGLTKTRCNFPLPSTRTLHRHYESRTGVAAHSVVSAVGQLTSKLLNKIQKRYLKKFTGTTISILRPTSVYRAYFLSTIFPISVKSEHNTYNKIVHFLWISLGYDFSPRIKQVGWRRQSTCHLIADSNGKIICCARGVLSRKLHGGDESLECTYAWKALWNPCEHSDMQRIARVVLALTS